MNLSNRKICVENFIKSLLPQADSNTIIFLMPFIAEVNGFSPFLTIFSADNGDFNDFPDVLIEDFNEGFVDLHFGFIRKFIENVTGRFLCGWRYDVDNKIEKFFNFSKERTLLINLDDPIAFSLLKMLILVGSIAHQFVVKITMIKSINTCRHY